ncbi:hypothetical protein DFQ30_003711 [Apophysomyces sp. BC1015]|nr:hypothetical protein DFQ30_003711 [Apophysomyces sp. BC1015]
MVGLDRFAYGVILKTNKIIRGSEDGLQPGSAISAAIFNKALIKQRRSPVYHWFPSQHEEHKKVILEYIDENPLAILEQLMERLLQTLEGPKVSKSIVYSFGNLSLKKVWFQPVDRNSEDKIRDCLDWVCKWEGTDMDFRTKCVFLDESAFHVNMKRSMI